MDVIEKPYPLIPVMHNYDAAKDGDVFHMFMDKHDKVIAMPIQFMKDNSHLIKEDMEGDLEAKDPSIPTVLVVSGNSDDESATFISEKMKRPFETFSIDIPQPIFDIQITPFPVDLSHVPSHKDVGLDEYPCIKLSWYLYPPLARGALYDEKTAINTKNIANDLKLFLKRQAISLQLYALHILHRTQGTLSDLLNHPKDWKLLTAKGRSEYLNMLSFLSASNLPTIIKKLKQKNLEGPSKKTKPVMLSGTFMNMLTHGIMPSHDDIINQRDTHGISEAVLREYCKDQLKSFNNEVDNKTPNMADIITRYHDNNRYICPVFNCGALLNGKHVIKAHMKVHEIYCSTCYIAFTTVKSLEEHQKSKHKETDVQHDLNNRYVCGVCKLSLQNRRTLAKHVLVTHKASFVHNGTTCHVCFRTLSTVTLLSGHMRMHTNHRSFPCTICSKSFKNKQNLQRHILTHGGEKPYKCEFCLSRFTEAKSLKIHMRKHNNDKPFKCKICSKGFTQKKILQSHELLHEDKFPFLCEICGRGFKQKANMKSHTMIHKGIKRFKCQHCSKAFAKKYDMKQHELRHTGEQPHKCTQCPRAFTRLSYLKDHMAKYKQGNGEAGHCKPQTPHDNIEEVGGSSTEQDFDDYIDKDDEIHLQCVEPIEISEPNAVFMSTGQIFNGQKQFLVTTGNEGEIEVQTGNGMVDENNSGGPLIFSPSNSDSCDNDHAVILQSVNMADDSLSEDSNATLLFADTSPPTTVMRSIVGLPMDTDDPQRREGMVEYSDPNMHSAIVESTDNDIIVPSNNNDNVKQLVLLSNGNVLFTMFLHESSKDDSGELLSDNASNM